MASIIGANGRGSVCLSTEIDRKYAVEQGLLPGEARFVLLLGENLGEKRRRKTDQYQWIVGKMAFILPISMHHFIAHLKFAVDVIQKNHTILSMVIA